MIQIHIDTFLLVTKNGGFFDLNKSCVEETKEQIFKKIFRKFHKYLTMP